MWTSGLLALSVVTAAFSLSHHDIDIFKFSDESRDRYLSQARNILHDNNIIGTGDLKMWKVDDMLYDYVELASQPTVYKDCIPFISEYTDCSIHNICVGCTVCHCDVLSRWNCSQVQRCSPEPSLELDHRILAMAMENLLEDENTLLKRRKRSLDQNENYENVSRWFYKLCPFDVEKNAIWYNRNASTATPNFEPLNMNFEHFLIDVLSGLHFHNEVNNNETEDVKRNNLNNSNYLDFVNMIESADNVTESVASLSDDKKTSEYDNVAIKDTDTFDNSNKVGLLRQKFEKLKILHNLRKRELLELNTTDINTNKSIAVFIKNITENTFYPLESIIKNKEDELSELKNIRDNLLASIDAYVGVQPIDSNSTLNKSDIHFIVYKLDYSNISLSLRKDNKNVLHTYRAKLDRDIQEVIKDIAVIQKVTKSSNVSYEYKYLIRVLRHFVKRKIKPNVNTKINTNHLRRRYNNANKVRPRKFNPLLLINNILEFLDKDMPQENILPSLSQYSMKIIMRLIKQLHTDELSYLNNKIKDNNIVKDLNDIGYNWQYEMVGVMNATPSEKLFKMKAFHLELSKGIDTIKGTLTMIGFAQRRRMSLVNDLKSEQAVMDHLIKIHDDIDRISKMAKKVPVINLRRNRKKNKQGFLEKVKNLLKKSKKDIRMVLKKKTPTDMMKRIAKRRLDDMTKKKLLLYENAMQQWREDFNMAPRRKRSPNEFNKFINRIKHIFPSRHRKVKPADKTDAKRNKTNTHDMSKKKHLKNRIAMMPSHKYHKNEHHNQNQPHTNKTQ